MYAYFASLFIMSALPSMAKAADSDIIALAGQSEVRSEDIKSLLESMPIRDQVILSKNQSAMNDFVRTLIIEQLVYREALEKKWDQQKNTVQLLERVRRQALTQSYLQSLATPPAGYPSASELQSAYEILNKNNALQVPRQIRLAKIFVACPKGSDKSLEDKAQEKVDGVMRSLKEGDFAVIAKSQSEDSASAQMNGEIGFLIESQIQGEIRSAIASLPVGKTTNPIRFKDGWYIFKVLEIKEPYTATLEEIKSPLKNDLRKQQSQAMGKAYITKILKENPVTINEIALSKLLENN